MILLNPAAKSLHNWGAARAMLAQSDFIRILKNFDVATVRPNTLKLLKPFVTKEHFNIEVVI
jgi:hypothetical protein